MAEQPKKTMLERVEEQRKKNLAAEEPRGREVTLTTGNVKKRGSSKSRERQQQCPGCRSSAATIIGLQALLSQSEQSNNALKSNNTKFKEEIHVRDTLILTLDENIETMDKDLTELTRELMEAQKLIERLTNELSKKG